MKEIAEKLARACARVEAQGLEVIAIDGYKNEGRIQLHEPKWMNGFEGHVRQCGEYTERSLFIDGIKVFWLTKNEEAADGN